MSERTQANVIHLSHDMPCSRCGHAKHTFLACSDWCNCVPPPTPGVYPPAGATASSMTASLPAA